MRQVLSLSLPEPMVKEIKSRTKARGFASVSDYIKTLVHSDQNLISEEELLTDIESARHEYETGQAVTAKSLADLL